jgi:APA family basic amino acid/polyamine antiporter
LKSEEAPKQTFIESLMRLKPVSEYIKSRQMVHTDETDPHKVIKFKNTLTYWQLVLLGFGNTIASGIFMLQGIAAKYAGAGVFVSFVIAGIVSLLTALIYAEFSSRMPFSGSGYIYIYSSFGELPAWVVGWNMNLRFGVTAGAQSKVWASYMIGLLNLLGIVVPVWMYHIELFGGTHVASLISIGFIITCTAISNKGS